MPRAGPDLLASPRRPPSQRGARNPVIHTPRLLAPRGSVGEGGLRGRGGPREGKVGLGCRRIFRGVRAAAGGPERSVSWGPARVQRAGFVWRARRGPGSLRGCRSRDGRQVAPEPAPARSLLAAGPRTPTSNRAGGPGLQVCVSGPRLGHSRGNFLSKANFKYKSRPNSIAKS